jgi:hypothetical protein
VASVAHCPRDVARNRPSTALPDALEHSPLVAQDEQDESGERLSCDCQCQRLDACNVDSAVDVLAHIRHHCGAVRMLAPDSAWERFQSWHQQKEPIACHRSVLVLALSRGHLGRVTSPIHHFLLTADGPTPGLRRQYLQDLRERWMFDPTTLGRHRKSRMFMGRLVELQVAEWLEGHGWSIGELEAFREGSDIEARLEGGSNVHFEVKFIGVDDLDFDRIVKAMSTGSSEAPVSPYTAANFLLFKVFEAATQLQRARGQRIALVVIDDAAWWRFDSILTHKWIDWSSPRFLNADDEWKRFLMQQQRRYPGLSTLLRSHLGTISEVWIVRREFGYEYVRAETIQLGQQVGAP